MRLARTLAVAVVLFGSLTLFGSPLAFACDQNMGCDSTGSGSSGSSSGDSSSSGTGTSSSGPSDSGSSDSSSSGKSHREPAAPAPVAPQDPGGDFVPANPGVPADPGGDFVPPAPAVPPDPGRDFVPPQAPTVAPVSAPPPAPAAVSSGETPTTDFEVRARSGVTIDLVVIQFSYQSVEVKNLSGGKSRTMSYLGVGVGVGVGFTMVERSDPVPYTTAQPATTADFGGFAGRGATPGATFGESSIGGDMHSNLGPPGNKPAKMPQNSAGLDLVLFNAGLGYWR